MLRMLSSQLFLFFVLFVTSYSSWSGSIGWSQSTHHGVAAGPSWLLDEGIVVVDDPSVVGWWWDDLFKRRIRLNLWAVPEVSEPTPESFRSISPPPLPPFYTHTHTQKKKKERKIKYHREIFFILFYYNYYSADITFAHTEYYICYTDYRAQPHSHRLPPAIRLHPWCAHGVKVAKMEMMITTWEKWTLDSRDRENIDDSSFGVVFFFFARD